MNEQLNLPTLSSDFVNALVENLLDERDSFPTIRYYPWLSFFQVLKPVVNYNREYRQIQSSLLIDLIADFPGLSISHRRDDLLSLALSVSQIYELDHVEIKSFFEKIDRRSPSPFEQKWYGQNYPVRIIDGSGVVERSIPLLAQLFDFDENTVDDLLNPPESYGWQDSLLNSFAFANNFYKVVYFTPSNRFGSIPDWFPSYDETGRIITEQAQIDRFLLLTNAAYGGFIDNHLNMNPFHIAQAIIELHDNWGEYLEAESDIEWEFVEEA